MRRRLLTLRWSWRDLRSRWLQVAAIALVVGIGSGTYSGLSSVSEWRRESYDASFEALRMFDLHVEFAPGAYVDERRLAEAVAGIPDAGSVEGSESRLIVPTQLDASRPGSTVLVQARVVGIGVDHPPEVSALDATEGRVLGPSDAGRPVVNVDEHFADEYDLPADAKLRLAGDVAVRSVGRVLQPEYFLVLGEQGDLFAAQSFAVLFAPLDWAQAYAGRPGQVDDLVVRVAPGAEDAVERQLDAALRAAFPDQGFDIVRREDDRAYRLMYDDVGGDQQFYDIFSVLILLGAAFAAFNLAGRVVESQRREIGIGMGLGVPPRRLAVRPLLFGAQIALVGVAFGVAVGFVINSSMRSLLAGFFPLPIWRTDFQPSVFLRGAFLGFVLPVLATLFPVWRAVRVPPVDAIRTSHRSASGGLAPLLRRLPLPGSSIAEMPVRNVARTPRRTLLTALGIAMALTVLVGVVGMIDTFLAAVDRGDAEILDDAPDRLTVGLDFTSEDAQVVRDVETSPLVATASPQLQLGGWLRPGDDEIEVYVTFLDFGNDVWRPTAVSGELRTDEPGIVLAGKAAEDLGVGVGDSVVLRHPTRVDAGYRFTETRLPVLAIHPNPYRFVAYMDRRYAGIAGLEGVVNALDVRPAPGVSPDAVQRGFFGRPGVRSVQPVRASAEAIRDRIDEVIGVFYVIEGAVLLLALLIAFNASSIGMDERRREHATMFAFGLPVRTVLRNGVVESLLIGILGTALGLGAGRLLLEWIVEVMVPRTVPEIGIDAVLSGGTIATAVALGVVAVTIAPLLTVRRLRRMDVPSTLRVVE